MDTRRTALVLVVAAWLVAGCARVEEGKRYASTGTRYYTVQRGETLSTIARRYGTSSRQLARENRIANPDLIEAGQRIRVPGLAKATQPLPRPTGSARATGKFAWPVRGTVIRRYGTSVGGIAARGMVIAARRGTPVLAADGGRVALSCEHMRGYGKVVALDHGNGYTTVYACNDELLVRQGESVRKGQAIARVGSTGRAQRSQLEFRLYRHGQPRDPSRYLR